jgi:cell division protein FtsQ
VVWAVITVLHAPFFEVSTIEVVGAGPLPASDIKGLAAIPKGETTLLLNKKGVRTRLLRDPWIEAVDISRKLPRTVELHLTLRQPIAFVELEDGERWLLAADGVWLASWDTTAGIASDPQGSFPEFSVETSGLIAVTGIEGLQPTAGDKNRAAILRNALAILNGLSSSLAAEVVELQAPDVVRTSLRTKDGIEIDIGSADDIATKDKIVREVLAEQKGKVVLINVRSVEHPIWRGLSQ